MKKFNSSIFATSAVGENFQSSKLRAVWTLSFLLFFSFISFSQDPCPMGCTNMNLSLDTAATGKVGVTPAMIMSNIPATCNPADLQVKLTDQYGRPLATDTVDCSHVGQKLTAKVVEMSTGNSCWSYVTVEDKVGPNLNCIVDTIYCVELDKYHEGLDRFPTGMAMDNCGGVEEYPVVISMYCEEYDCDENPEFSGKCIRKLFAKDRWGSSVECTDTFYVRRVPLDSIKCPVDTLIECCFADSVDLDGDGAPDPEFTGVPQVYIASMDTCINLYPGGNDVCKTFAHYKDHEWPICGKGRKIKRVWEIVDWCRDTTIICEQFIKIVDTLKPEIEKYDDIMEYASPHECKAIVEIPYPEIIKECAGVKEVKVEISYYDYHENKLQTEYKEILPGKTATIYPLAGCWEAYIYVTDSCLNTCIDTFEVCVKDNTPPTPVCDQITKTTLDPNSCWARIYATTFDDGSSDNCCDKLHFSAAPKEEVLAQREAWRTGLQDLLGMSSYNLYRHDLETWIEIWLDCNIFFDYVEFNDCVQEEYVATRVYSKCHMQKYYDPHLHGSSEHHFFCAETYKNSLGSAYAKGLTLDSIANNITGFLADVTGIKDSCLIYFNECWVEVNVDDKIAPYCIPSPDITTFCDGVIQHPDSLNAKMAECGDHIRSEEGYENCVECAYWHRLDDADVRVDPKLLFTRPEFVDNCSELTVDSTMTGDLDDCGEGVFTMTWTVRDACGNEGTCSQTVTVDHRSDFEVKFPADSTIFCASNGDFDLAPEKLGKPIVTDDECEQIGMSWTDETFTIVEDACLKIIRTWTVIDWCEYDPNQQIRYTDICNEEDCPAGPDRPDVTRSLKDNGDGYVRYTQIIKVRNQVGPEVRFTRDSIVCANDPNTCTGFASFAVEASDDCTLDEDLEWRIFLDQGCTDIYEELPRQVGGTAAIDIPAPVGCHKIRFIVSDECGNLRDTTVMFEIEMCKKPTPYCVGKTITLMDVPEPINGMVTIWASDLDAGSFAYCDPNGIAAFSFSSDTTDTNLELTCENLGDTTVQMWVTDMFGNQDFCEVTITVQDNMGNCPIVDFRTATVSGEILTENDISIVKTKVEMNGSGSQPITTGEDGTFTFPRMALGGTYSIDPGKDINHDNGVSTLDLVLIQKHILGITTLNSPYKIIAADIDNNKSITALDLVQLRRLILGLDEQFTKNESWRFISKDYVFKNANDPLNEDFMEKYAIQGLDKDMKVDFIGVKVGDVNGTVTPSELQGATVRSNRSLVLLIEEKSFDAQSTVKVPVTAANFNDITGYQFTLEFDAEVLAFRNIESGLINVSENNFGLHHVNQGFITTSWNEAQGITLDQEEVLFTLVFDANKSGEIADILAINSTMTNAEAYDDQLNLYGVKIDVIDGQVTNNEFVLMQNNPNPFNQQTTINFILPEAGKAALSIMDVNGKLLKSIQGEFNKGLNQVVIDRADLNHAGVLYYQLETDRYNATKKMIIVK